MPYGLPHLADATDLDRWADTRSAQADLPRLVRRLIRAENDQVQRVEMRGGEGVGLPGYDGFVETGRATSFVPEGKSVWEMGVGGNPAAKAQSDYRSRTDDPRGIDPAEHTFVFVTPRRWDDKKDWGSGGARRESGATSAFSMPMTSSKPWMSRPRFKSGCRSCSAWNRLGRCPLRTGGGGTPGGSTRR